VVDYDQSLGAIIGRMDHYTSERWLLDNHRRMVEAAERRMRLAPETAPLPGLRVWAACRLRSLADRLDGKAQLQRV